MIAQLLLDNVVAEVDALSVTNGALADGTGAGDPVDQAAIASLVVPQLVTPSPPDDVTNVGVDEWPFLAVSVRSTPRIRQLDMDPWAGSGQPRAAGTVFDVDYAARIYTWVRGDGYAQTKAVRDRLMLTVRQVILRNQVVGPVRLVAPTVSEEFAPIGVDAALEASIGAGWTQATWRAQETLDAATYGAPAQVTVTVRPDTP